MTTPLVLVLALIAAATASGQDKRLPGLVDLLNMPDLTDPHLSPDGRSLIFEQGNADWAENRFIRHLWKVDRDGRNALQLTTGLEDAGDVRWSPDGSTVAFIAKRGKDESAQIYLIPISGGEARRLTEHPTNVADIKWSPDGSLLYFLAADDESKALKERKKAQDDVYSFDENVQNKHLWSVKVSDGTRKKLTDGPFSLAYFDLSADGTQIVFTRAPSALLSEMLSERLQMWVMRSSGTDARQVPVKTEFMYDNFESSPDNRSVLYLSTLSAVGESYHEAHLFVVNTAGGAARMLLGDFDHEIMGAHWSRDGHKIYFAANLGVRSDLFEVDPLTGKRAQLTTGDHTLAEWHYDRSTDEHVFTLASNDDPGEIWIRDARGKTRKVTAVFDDFLRTFRTSTQKLVSWRGEDGANVEGLLSLPPGYREGVRVPLVVATHGGPQWSDKYGSLFNMWSGRLFVPEMALNSKGYAVLRPNYRGSTGYGDAFLRDMVGGYYRQSHKDVMAGTDSMISRGIADPERLVAMGWSAGGGMTDKLVTYTNRFKAASAGAGVSDWISMFGTTDNRWHRVNWFGGTPWEEKAPIASYWDNSPLKDVWRVKTPTLLFVGANDPRVPMGQSVEFYRALKFNGVDTHLYVAPREGHGFMELRHALYKNNTELAWFDKYAMGREYQPEQPPVVTTR
jgi:dipeptidyl aminopeptidase/acylaminoacyl peptidase